MIAEKGKKRSKAQKTSANRATQLKSYRINKHLHIFLVAEPKQGEHNLRFDEPKRGGQDKAATESLWCRGVAAEAPEVEWGAAATESPWSREAVAEEQWNATTGRRNKARSDTEGRTPRSDAEERTPKRKETGRAAPKEKPHSNGQDKINDATQGNTEKRKRGRREPNPHSPE